MSDPAAPPKPSPGPSIEEILASIRRIIAEDEKRDPEPAAAAKRNSDVLDLTEALEEDGSVRHIAPNAAPAAPIPPLPDGRIEPDPPRPPQGVKPERLVSEGAAEAVAAGFARLGAVPRERRRDGDMLLGAGERTLEDIVRDLLRPMLQAWLDNNLPALVERLVRAEIARMADEAERR